MDKEPPGCLEGRQPIATRGRVLSHRSSPSRNFARGCPLLMPERRIKATKPGIQQRRPERQRGERRGKERGERDGKRGGDREEVFSPFPRQKLHPSASKLLEVRLELVSMQPTCKATWAGRGRRQAHTHSEGQSLTQRSPERLKSSC